MPLDALVPTPTGCNGRLRLARTGHRGAVRSVCAGGDFDIGELEVLANQWIHRFVDGFLGREQHRGPVLLGDSLPLAVKQHARRQLVGHPPYQLQVDADAGNVPSMAEHR